MEPLGGTEKLLERLMTEHPLVWVVSGAGARLLATPVPVQPISGPQGGIIALRGHFARSNPQVAALKADPRALVLGMGPGAYVSPSWLSDRTQAPTWNYAAARFAVDVRLMDEVATREVLRDLVSAMEAGRQNAWRIEEMGARYDRLASRIVGFRAEVLEASPAMKLGQTESMGQFHEMLAGLQEDGAADLATWMMSARTVADRA